MTRADALEQAFRTLREVAHVPWTGREAAEWWDRRVVAIHAVEQAAPEGGQNIPTIFPRGSIGASTQSCETQIGDEEKYHWREAIREAYILLQSHLHANGPCQKCDWLALPAVVKARKEEGEP